jgi:hypothetical protein
MSCEERVRLEEEHEQASARFDAAREALNERIGVSSRAEFRALSEGLDNAWVGLRRARTALDNDVWEHQCVSTATSTS